MRHWVRKSRDSGRNADLNDQPWSGRPVTTTHYVNRQKLTNLLEKKKLKNFSDSHSRKLNIGLSCVNEITTGLTLKKLCARWVPYQLMPEMKTARLEPYQQLHSRYKSEGNDFLYSNVTKDESWVHHCNLESKSQSLEYSHFTSPRNIKPILSLPLENACSELSVTTEASYTRSTWSKA